MFRIWIRSATMGDREPEIDDGQERAMLEWVMRNTQTEVGN